MTYELRDFWNKRVMPTSCDAEYTKKHVEYVQKHTDGLLTIFDYGPGIGRIFEAYPPGSFVMGYDISAIYAKRITDEAAKYPFRYDHMIGNDGILIPHMLIRNFDAVVACEVLMHQPPWMVVDTMRSLASVGKKVIVVSWHEEGKPYENHNCSQHELYTHCFMYNYTLICKENGWQIWDWQQYRQQVMFVYKT